MSEKSSIFHSTTMLEVIEKYFMVHTSLGRKDDMEKVMNAEPHFLVLLVVIFFIRMCM